jgi:vancomycin resistance protein YoaR
MAKKKNKKISGVRFGRKVFLIVFALSALILAGVFSAYSYDYRDRVYPNIYLNGKNLGGQKVQDLAPQIDKITDDYQKQEITIAISDKEKKIKIGDLGWSVDTSATAKKIYDFGRNPNFLKLLLERLKGLFGRNEITPVYSVNQNALDDWLNLIQNELGKPKQEANIQITSRGAKIIEPSSGQILDENEIRPKIVKIFEFAGPLKITTQLHEDKPTITKEDAQNLIPEAEKLTQNNVILTAPKGDFTLKPEIYAGWIEIRRQTEEKKTLIKKEVKYGPAYVSFSDTKIKNYLEKHLDDLNIPPKDAKLAFSGGSVSVVQQSVAGRVIDVDESVKEIREALEKGDGKIKLSDREKEPAIDAKTASDIEKYGIRELVGTATTNFARSPSNRIHNIQNGVSFLTGVLIAPGEEFSTLKQLGSIDGSTGYLPELVIKENRTIPEYGGGLCQVSTTLFRAALNSGLKITERQNHSYRVSYYEPPVGMDATVYSPSPDLKFVNNTDNYILIQGHVDGNNVTFDFYGTKDGRQVQISDPVMYDVTPPGDPIYTDDPSLPAGVEKQTDRAHPGAKATFTYKVTKDGKTIINQTFNSVYVPWPAKILRGTGEPAQGGEQ